MPMPAPAGSGWPRQGEHAARCRQREEYAARRALFLQTYRLSAPGEDDDEEAAAATGLRGRAARLLREARVAGRAAAARAACRAWVAGRASAAGAASRARSWLGAGLGSAWRGWTRRPLLRARAHGHGHLHHRSSLLGCFGGRYRYLQGFA
ncbi:uncharacterized protein [Aegilops tauschii subsp. strangulata]|uniref:uncharacterized protein n=1 Tax=Aegilops tauschii subsp. strangulata TaxID=200361 RepID=UPI001E1CAB55|nr:uncharacterized protein LOC120964029 [Aegilops tauschii subsp. strangulata]